MSANPTNPAIEPEQRQAIAEIVHLAAAMLDADIEQLVELRQACERSGSFDQVNRLSAGIDELKTSRDQLVDQLRELQS